MCPNEALLLQPRDLFCVARVCLSSRPDCVSTLLDLSMPSGRDELGFPCRRIVREVKSWPHYHWLQLRGVTRTEEESVKEQARPQNTFGDLSSLF